jgi:hypothetical protein
MLRPRADHEALRKIAANGEGRFRFLDEAELLQFLDDLKAEVSQEARQRIRHWPDWNRLPASDHPRDQISGLWNSLALVSLGLFVALLSCEWGLRRLWGLV